MSDSSTILAVASPPGRSLRGLVRVSGPDTFGLLAPRIEHQEDKRVRIAHGLRRARLTLPSLAPLSITILVSPAPHSYTGEDTVELQMPGNPLLLERVIDVLIVSGADRDIDVRRAEPGEFTARAYLNNRLSLTQAEGVAATIAAQSDAELAAARLLVSGRLGDFAHGLADDLAAALALAEAGIDFTDQEDVVAISPHDLHARLIDLRARLSEQLAHAVGFEQLRAIPWVVLVGEPNAGKSALFNALLGRERAVVSPIAGTTRDVLAEPLAIDIDHGRAEVMLVDLAGLDETDASTINALMQSAARAAIDRADLKLLCVPPDAVEQPVPAHDQILVCTKSDLAAGPSANAELAASAFTGAGLDDLRRAIAARLSARAVSLAAGALALQPRHEAAMRAALANFDEALKLLQPARDTRALPDPELLASSMRSALDDLSSLAGDITPDDILGRIFATFCVGK